MDKNAGSFIALLTDFGLQDPYIGIMKGVINTINPVARIIDITHGISPQKVGQGAFILSKAWRFFPKGAIFVAVVDPGVGGRRAALAAKVGENVFIAPDNGILWPILEKEESAEVFEITNPDVMLHPISSTFHGRDVFAPAAAHLSKGFPISKIGRRLDKFERLSLPAPRLDDRGISGHVLFADRFGNLITNVKEEYLRGKPVSSISVGGQKIDRLSGSYQDSPAGCLIALVGSYGVVEISVRDDSAASLFENVEGIEVEVEFQ